MYDSEYKTPMYRLRRVDEFGETWYYGTSLTNEPYVADKDTLEELKNTHNFLKSYSIERVN